MAKSRRVPISALREAFVLDETSPSGLRRKRDGKVAGTQLPRGHWQVRATHGGIHTILKVHRVVYALHYGRHPQGVIDHINNNPSDNSISNLRDTDQRTNARNIGDLSSKNTSGFPCVHWGNNRWRVRVRAFGKPRHFGHFASKDQAIVAAFEAKLAHHPEAAAFFERFRGEYEAALARL